MASETKWTPGPWRAYDNGTCWQIDAEAHAVATTQFCYARETAANARLIAAAPEVYEALHNAAVLLKALTRPTDEIAQATVAACETALAEARGDG